MVKHANAAKHANCAMHARTDMASVAWMLQEHVRREKEVQTECCSPHMVNLVASYKDAAYLYMLLECIMGGELFTYLQVSLQITLMLQHPYTYTHGGCSHNLAAALCSACVCLCACACVHVASQAMLCSSRHM